jgi:hypothetical protein
MLLTKFGNPSSSLVRTHRSTGLRLTSQIVIRDQRPMPPQALARCLTDNLRPEDWFELLNSKIFFWLDPKRLNRQRMACGSEPQIALIVDGRHLLTNYGAMASVTPINTGNAMRAAARRNFTTFVPYERWLLDAWTYEEVPGATPRPMHHRPVELCISDAIPDIADYIIEIIPLAAGEILSS